MDSPNSGGGSIQSSSGGGGAADADDYDSRNESISSFFNSSSTHFHPTPVLQPPPPADRHQPPTTDPNFFDPFSSPNPIYNLESVWARNVRPDPNFSGFGANGLLGSDQGVYPSQSPVDNPNPGHGSDRREATRNPKKRTRASRRAPTTVLTTDTSNFRQMVQEFTGIPAAPFSAAASSSLSRRMDLFGGGGGAGQMFPLRPSAQKLRQEFPITGDASSSNYPIPPSDIHGFQKHPQGLLNLQSPVFSFQSLLQTKLPEQGTAKSDDQQTDFFPGSSTRWRGQDENLASFEGGNGNNQSIEGYKLNSSDFNQHNEKGLENVVVSSRTEGNVDSWVCPSD